MNHYFIQGRASFFLLFSLAFTLSLSAQVNTSQEINYKARSGGFHSYTTNYDNGYVQLNDGTRLEGKISLIGTSYKNVYGVRIKTNSGRKYSFFPRSLSEYGLSNSIVNDTPGEFIWYEVDRGVSKFVSGVSGGNKAISEGRNGYADFGYVTTKSGKTYEGRVDIKEVKQKIKKIDVKTVDKEKYSFEAEEVSNFGVAKYVDDKFNTSFNLLNWKYDESEQISGFVELNTGEKHAGKLKLVKRLGLINQVQIKPLVGKGKVIKIKYVDIKKYGVNIDVAHVYKRLETEKRSLDLVHPERKFYTGELRLENGTLKKGLIAKVKPGQITDVIFAENKNSQVEYFYSDNVDVVVQDISSQEMRDYELRLYDATHVLDYPIDNTSRWKYKTRNEGSSRTMYMWGYLIPDSGTPQIGEVSIRTVGALKTYFIRKNGAETKFKSIRGIGLLASKEKDVRPGNETAGNEITEDEFEAYDPLEDSFLATKTTDASVESNGYVITSSGEKKEGAVSVSAPPQLWFATDVKLTTTDGTVTNYINDGSLKKIVVTIDGKEKEFINFENEYVEVLHRDGDLVHFRNPHPTTQTNSGDLFNTVAGAAIESVDQSLSTMGGGITKPSSEKVDWTKEEVIKLYAQEFLILNEKSGKYAMYIPKKQYRQVEGDLMGSIEYLQMSKEQQEVYRKMTNPLATIKYLNEKIYNK